MAREQQDLEEFKDLTLADFTFVGTLGMGGFGRVELVCIIHVTFEVVTYRCICMKTYFAINVKCMLQICVLSYAKEPLLIWFSVST